MTKSVTPPPPLPPPPLPAQFISIFSPLDIAIVLRDHNVVVLEDAERATTSKEGLDISILLGSASCSHPTEKQYMM